VYPLGNPLGLIDNAETPEETKATRHQKNQLLKIIKIDFARPK
jgi:hypothetical protein